LLSVLYNLRAEHLPWYEQIEDALRAGFPTLNKLDFPIVGAGQVSMAWHDRAHSSPVFANEISAGTLRFLHLCTLLLSPEPPQVILLDEPEVSLHPHLLRLLADLLIQAADRSQIFVATHAAGLLRWLKPEHVVVTDRSEEGVRMRRGDDMSLSGWLDQYSLDQLWEMGEIGGRP
jgi:predicted ATPase